MNRFYVDKKNPVDNFRFMEIYNKTINHYFFYPQHCYKIDDANAYAEVGSPECGDYLRMWLRIDDEIIDRVGFKCQGCPAAIASSEAACRLALDCTVNEALKISDDDIIVKLGGLPQEKEHCSNLGARVLQKALVEYKTKH